MFATMGFHGFDWRNYAMALVIVSTSPSSNAV
jgi:hypothetical protein